MLVVEAVNYFTSPEYVVVKISCASVDVVKRYTQNLPQPNSRIYVGPGKLDEIASYCTEHEVDMVIFDDELSPSQTRHIEKIRGRKVLVRARWFLDMFL